jgi:hypothetical protein
VCPESAVYIHRRRFRIALAKETLAYVNGVIKQEEATHEFETVQYIYDCYRQACKKSLKAKQGEGVATNITKNWKKYKDFVKLLPILTERKVNPLSFFIFTIEARKKKKIPFKLSNVVTANSLDHYLQYLKSNTYRVATFANFKDYEDTLHNQLNIDLVSLVTYLLRKPRVSVHSCEEFLFSSFSKILLNFSKNPVWELTKDEQIFYEDLKFDPEFLERVKLKWNQSLEDQIQKVGQMIHPYLDANFTRKLHEIMRLLLVLKFV